MVEIVREVQRNEQLEFCLDCLIAKDWTPALRQENFETTCRSSGGMNGPEVEGKPPFYVPFVTYVRPSSLARIDRFHSVQGRSAR